MEWALCRARESKRFLVLRLPTTTKTHITCYDGEKQKIPFIYFSSCRWLKDKQWLCNIGVGWLGIWDVLRHGNCLFLRILFKVILFKSTSHHIWEKLLLQRTWTLLEKQVISNILISAFSQLIKMILNLPRLQSSPFEQPGHCKNIENSFACEKNTKITNFPATFLIWIISEFASDSFFTFTEFLVDARRCGFYYTSPAALAREKARLKIHQRHCEIKYDCSNNHSHIFQLPPEIIRPEEWI